MEGLRATVESINTRSVSLEAKVDQLLDLCQGKFRPKGEPSNVTPRSKETEEYERLLKAKDAKIASLQAQLKARQNALNEEIAKQQQEVRLAYPGAFPLEVRFPDGTLISEVTGVATYLRAIKKLGVAACIEVAPNLFRWGEVKKGWYFDEKDGWSIRVHITYAKMKSRIEDLARFLAIPITCTIR